MMAARTRDRRPPWRVEFARHKYGPELLIDAALLSDMPAFRPTADPHALSFLDILLVTKGRGWYEIDGQRHAVRPGLLIVTLPGQVRRWDVAGLDGACVFFTREFLRDAFADARFLDQFAFFNAGRPSAVLTVSKTERAQFLRRFGRMREELRSIREDVSELLRARLYELLVLMNRWYRLRHANARTTSRNDVVVRFQAMLDREFRQLHRVRDYAARLGVSSGHLNVLCRTHLGRSASTEIHQRLMLEAKRLLRYTGKPAFVVARELGFADPAYFGRFFRRDMRTTPRKYRSA